MRQKNSKLKFKNRLPRSAHSIPFKLPIGLLILGLLLLLSACTPNNQPTATGIAPSPTTAPTDVAPPSEPLPWNQLDTTWGPYLAEREWGNPREAIQRGNGWSFSYEKALSTPYQFGDDGIAGITNQNLDVAFAPAFFRPGESYMTERLYGLDGPSGKFGETILEDRIFYENTPSHSYLRYGYNYQDNFVQTTIEYAKRDNQTLVAQITLTGLSDAAQAPFHLIPEVWFPAVSQTGGEVLHANAQTWDATYANEHFVVVADQPPDAWQITANQYPHRADINAALVNQNTLENHGEGDKAAWDFIIDLTPGETVTLRFGLAHAATFEAAHAAAKTALENADNLLTMRKTEAQSLYKNDVTHHQAIYQAALMNLLWNKMYYAYDGSFQPEWRGKVDLHDVILVPDKWEFPWPAMWDTAFQAKVASLTDVELAKQNLQLFLSDRWQTDTGHIPNVEWSLEGETPPLFAWAAWQIYQTDKDRAFLESIFPSLENHYTFVRKAYDYDHDSLHTGGFMGMDNIPRPGKPDEEEADLSGWVAFFARDMANIATEIGQPDRAEFYQSEYAQIIAQINVQLWDEETGFYYDRNAHGFLLEKSYTGLIPFIAGASNEAQTARIIEHLTNPSEFWTPYGIRSLSADSAIYEPGYSESGWKNSNWRGPIWLPINYLLVQRLAETRPDLAKQLRLSLISNVENQWQDTGHFWEYYHAETGQGLGADHQTGWTALVANLIYEAYGNH